MCKGNLSYFSKHFRNATRYEYVAVAKKRIMSDQSMVICNHLKQNSLKNITDISKEKKREFVHSDHSS